MANNSFDELYEELKKADHKARIADWIKEMRTYAYIYSASALYDNSNPFLVPIPKDSSGFEGIPYKKPVKTEE